MNLIARVEIWLTSICIDVVVPHMGHRLNYFLFYDEYTLNYTAPAPVYHRSRTCLFGNYT